MKLKENSKYKTKHKIKFNKKYRTKSKKKHGTRKKSSKQYITSKKSAGKIIKLNIKYHKQTGGAVKITSEHFKNLIKPGSHINFQYNLGITTHQTLGECVKELIEASYQVYEDLLKEVRNSQDPVTIICGGQSPTYYCLAMMNFEIYNPDLVNILILPHSKGGDKTLGAQHQIESELYCQRLKEVNIEPRKNVVILDGVHTGVGILAMESALKICYPGTKTRKYAINVDESIAEIQVDKLIKLECEPKFSDSFPRLIISYVA